MRAVADLRINKKTILFISKNHYFLLEEELPDVPLLELERVVLLLLGRTVLLELECVVLLLLGRTVLLELERVVLLLLGRTVLLELERVVLLLGRTVLLELGLTTTP